MAYTGVVKTNIIQYVLFPDKYSVLLIYLLPDKYSVFLIYLLPDKYSVLLIYLLPDKYLIIKAIYKDKNKKAVGIDFLPNEILKKQLSVMVVTS